MKEKNKYFPKVNIIDPQLSCLQVIQMNPYAIKMQIINQDLIDYLILNTYSIYYDPNPKIFVANPANYSEFLVIVDSFYN